ncbi:hypothetical protein ACH5RR_019378 [Cinchona calisaya]|uniref:Anaphase-promoting complex subunit 1 n=1 Tax=Cinchona calisaya TaxID=153742 RepID=A0ABD2ZPF3_9GENT
MPETKVNYPNQEPGRGKISENNRGGKVVEWSGRKSGEIGRRSGGDNVLEREGYAVSAGFSLGLVALGRGEDALGFMETLVDRLFQFIGGQEQKNERFHFLTQSVDEHQRTAGQVMDGTFNVDDTAPGAIVALALMYMKTESKLILSRLSNPQTHFDLQYVRPDFIMLRTKFDTLEQSLSF